jgi:hypothetical protein
MHLFGHFWTPKVAMEKRGRGRGTDPFDPLTAVNVFEMGSWLLVPATAFLALLVLWMFAWAR